MFYRPAALLALLALLVTLFGCISASNITATSTITATTPFTTVPPVIKNVSPVQADQVIRANKDNANYIIIDVRTPAEYAGGHLVKAVNIDYNASDFKDRVNLLDKNRTYLVYCQTANRSSSAVKVMAEVGFKDIYHMTGGIVEWQAEGLAVVK
jgi:rhodanese-related sulfurtransferase